MSSTDFDKWVENFMIEYLPDNDPLDLPSVRERQAMSDYLNGTISSEEAAILCTRDMLKSQTQGDLWFLIYHVAQDMPETHGRLVDLLKAISLLPPEPRDNGRVQYWGTLSQFTFDLREYWDGKSDCLENDSDPKLHQGFIDLTTFNARLLGQGILHVEPWAVMTLHIALEKGYETQPHLLNTLVPAATQYIKWAAPAVFTSYKHCIAPGELLIKASDISGIDRWHFWKERLTAIGNQEDLEQETRKAAKSAISRMTDTEKFST